MTSEFLDVAATVLAKQGKPMSAKEVVDFATEHKMFSDRVAGKTPFQTMKAKLSVDIRRKGSVSRFVRTAPGRFFLRANLDEKLQEYKARPYSKPPPKERVLTIVRGEFERHIHFQGINRAYKRIQRLLLRPDVCEYVPRLKAEVSEDRKQVLTYILVTRGDSVLCFQRGNYNRVEDYLRGSSCVGFGGHVAEEDNSLFTKEDMGLFESARRELFEELNLPIKDQKRLHAGIGLSVVGVLNDDSSPVGRRHVAFVFRYEVSDDDYWEKPQKGEKSIAQLHWVRPLDSYPIWKFEYWSQLCIRQFFPQFAKSASAYRVIRAQRLQRASVVCVIGILGSGKTEAVRVLAGGFGYQEINSGRVLAKLLGLPPVSHKTRAEFQYKAFKFIKNPQGPRRLAIAIAREIEKARGRRVVVDGIRQKQTFHALCEAVGQKNVAVVYVHTLPDIAFGFYTERAGREIPFDIFLKLRDAEVEQEIPSFLSVADAVIYNWFGHTSYLHTIREMFEKNKD